ncbi:hypothetical protein IWQ62_001463 [Dispira parvispora]|uniref:Coiled-coil SMC6 And NSE5 INteracting (CANIN) domain-containing protein n=1 Tax=Dispira parvispora TaxID=1520584 RepID=A0A9W8ASB7_9FUNG|nr:hypothetical protein IWQ62_001463 [Dispira parvispora]
MPQQSSRSKKKPPRNDEQPSLTAFFSKAGSANRNSSNDTKSGPVKRKSSTELPNTRLPPSNRMPSLKKWASASEHTTPLLRSSEPDIETTDKLPLSQPTKPLSSFTLYIPSGDEDDMESNSHAPGTTETPCSPSSAPIKWIHIPSDLSDSGSDEESTPREKNKSKPKGISKGKRPVKSGDSTPVTYRYNTRQRNKKPSADTPQVESDKKSEEPVTSRKFLSDVDVIIVERDIQFTLDNLLKQKSKSRVQYSKLESLIDQRLLDENKEVDFVYNRDVLLDQVADKDQQKCLTNILESKDERRLTAAFAVFDGKPLREQPWSNFSINSPPAPTGRPPPPGTDRYSVLWSEIIKNHDMVRPALASNWLLNTMRQGWVLPVPMAQWLCNIMCFTAPSEPVTQAYHTLAWYFDYQVAPPTFTPTLGVNPVESSQPVWTVKTSTLLELLLYYGARSDVLQPNFTLPAEDSTTSPASPASGSPDVAAPNWGPNLCFVLRLLNRSICCRPTMYTQLTLCHLLSTLLCCALDPVMSPYHPEISSLILTILWAFPDSTWESQLEHLTTVLVRIGLNRVQCLVKWVSWIPVTAQWDHPLVRYREYYQPVSWSSLIPNASTTTYTTSDGEATTESKAKPKIRPLCTSKTRQSGASEDEPGSPMSIDEASFVTCSSQIMQDGETGVNTTSLPEALARCQQFQRTLAYRALKAMVSPNPSDSQTLSTSPTKQSSEEPLNSPGIPLTITPLVMWHNLLDWLTHSTYFSINDQTKFCHMYTTMQLVDYVLQGNDQMIRHASIIQSLFTTLRSLYGKIVDSTASLLDRTRTKDLIQRLYLRLYFTVSYPTQIRRADGSDSVPTDQKSLLNFLSPQKS